MNDMGFMVNLNKPEELSYLYDMYLENNQELYLEDFKDIIDNSLASDLKGNRYLSEIAFNIKKTYVKKVSTNKYPIYTKSDRISCRRKWIQFNIYIENCFQADFIKNHVADALEKWDILYKDFFLVRYFDGRDHIRFRIHRDIGQNKILKIEGYLDNITGIFWEHGTYNPEIERYGGKKLIHIAENFFGIDSYLCIEILGKMDLYIEIFIFLTSVILKNFFDSLEDKLKVVDANFSKREYANEFRKNRDSYENYYNMAYFAQIDKFLQLTGINCKISHEWIRSIEAYASLVKEAADVDSKKEIALSLIHMMCNRTFGINSEQEKMLMNIICRLLKCKIAKERITNLK